ncbi:hypothetical protein HDU81_003666 [Chytriomyces hyalinus]|nr:hypothetical protein HDU81_003666 [Chytriomyces hyalinus]
MSKQLKPLKGTKPLSDAIMKFPPTTSSSSFTVMPSPVSNKPSRRTTPSPPPTASKPTKSRPQYPGRLAKLEVAPSAEPTSSSTSSTTTSHLLRRAVIPAIAKIESTQQKSQTSPFQDDLLRVPVVLKYRDGTRTKLSVPGSSVLVDEIRRKLVAKFGAARALQMSLFVHDCKLVGGCSSEADASEAVGGCESKMSGATHSPLKLNSDAYCFATARQVFGESGGLVLVE